MFSCVLLLVKSKELTPPPSRCVVVVRFCRDFVVNRDRGCVQHLVGEGKPQHPSHLRKALTCLYLLLFVAMLACDMSLSVTVIALPLHADRIVAMLLCCYAMLYYCYAMP